MNDMTPTPAERAEKLEGMGCKRKRVEDIRFVQGKGNYVDDLKLPGMLYGDFNRSPHAHARIKKIDTKKAEAVPGVVAVSLDLFQLKGFGTLTAKERAVRAVTFAPVQEHVRIFPARPCPTDPGLIDRYARAGFRGPPPPVLAAMVISLMRRVKILPRLASSAPFLCLIVAHFEWPDMDYLGGDLACACGGLRGYSALRSYHVGRVAGLGGWVGAASCVGFLGLMLRI